MTDPKQATRNAIHRNRQLPLLSMAATGTCGSDEPIVTAELGLWWVLAHQSAIGSGQLSGIVAHLERDLDVLAVREFTLAERHRLRRGGSAVTSARVLSNAGALIAVLNPYSGSGPPTSEKADRSRQDSHVQRALQRLRRSLPLHDGQHCSERGIVAYDATSDVGWRLGQLFSGMVDSVWSEAHRRKLEFRTPFPVLDRLGGHGRRAKVELVDYDGMLAVCKTFRAGQERFLERELKARCGLPRSIRGLPAFLASGPNWVLTPFYEQALDFDTRGYRLLPLERAVEILGLLEGLYHAGYALLDISLNNLRCDETGRIKVVDCEFLHKYDQRPARFADSYDIVGVPRNFVGDRPEIAGARAGSTYATRLQPFIGLTFQGLRRDPRWKQRLKRTCNWCAVFLPRAFARPLRELLYRGIRRVRIRAFSG